MPQPTQSNPLPAASASDHNSPSPGSSDHTSLSPEDFYFDGPYLVFTEAFHRKRGYCCNSGCRHCPYR